MTFQVCRTSKSSGNKNRYLYAYIHRVTILFFFFLRIATRLPTRARDRIVCMCMYPLAIGPLDISARGDLLHVPRFPFSR